MITLNYELDQEDYFQFFYYTLWLAPGKKAEAIKARGKNFLMIVLGLTMVKLVPAPHSLDLFYFYVIFVLLSIFITPLFYFKNTCRKQALAFYNDPLNADSFSASEMILSETGIFAKCIHSETKYQWNRINKKVEIAEHFILYISAGQAIIIPKRAIKTEAEMAGLLELFGKHISFNAEVGHLVKE